MDLCSAKPDGNIIKRCAPTVEPKQIKADIETLPGVNDRVMLIFRSIP